VERTLLSAAFDSDVVFDLQQCLSRHYRTAILSCISPEPEVKTLVRGVGLPPALRERLGCLPLARLYLRASYIQGRGVDAMRSLRPSASRQFPTLTLVAAIFCTLSLNQFSTAQQPAALLEGAPRPLITQPVNEAQLSVLKGNTHPLARPEFDLGTAPATLPMQRMLLVLKRSPEQESTLRQLLDNQQDKSSPSYHKWLTPADYGKQFGPTDADMQTITAWLQSHGFEVASTKGRTVLEFSGSASQVQQAFHTTIHKYIVNGEQHWANANDPSIPEALTPAVAGVLTLHNFLKKPTIHLNQEAIPAKLLPGKKPQVTFSQNGKVTHALAPQDYSVIYNASVAVIGESTIAVVGRSNLYNGGQDVADFQSVFGGATFFVVLDGPDPGDLGGGDEAEATLDSSWSEALAPGARVSLVVSASTNTTDGVDLSETYIIEQNLAAIMTESFSACEFYATDALLSGASALAEQAAAQGITYFVSTGDNGAEGCDDPSVAPATHPISVNYLASTAFNVAVGGTMFNENGQDSKYWGSEPAVEESAISYIPEDVWNESSPTAGLWAGSGGASAGNIGSGGTTPGVAKPNWQYGVVGIPADKMRDLPDVSLTAASHDPYLLCLEGSCVRNSQGEFFVYFASGTSAAAPSFASIMALVNDQNSRTTGELRQGLANYVLYRLAASQAAYPSLCDGSSTSTPLASACIFNDVTVGNNVVPGESGTEYQAATGYDLATGLGSVNVANLVTQWNTVTFNPTTTTLSVTPNTITHGSPVPFTVSVTPNSTTGVPTGDVSLTAYTSGYNQPINVGVWTLAGGSLSSTVTALPGGNTWVGAFYAGDATFAPSTSVPSFAFTVNPEPSTTTPSVLTVNSQGAALPFTNGPFGSFVYLRADVAGLSGHGAPTGSVTFADTFGPIPGGDVFQLNAGYQPNNGSNTGTPNGVLSFDTGSHTISASYSGDASFNPSSSTQSLSFTIQPGFFVVFPPDQSTLTISAPGSLASTAVNVTNSTGFTGTVSFSCSALPTGASCQFNPPTITAAGTLATTFSTITVQTAAPTASVQTPPRPYLGNWLAAASFAFFSVVLAGGSRKRWPLQFLLPLLMLLAMVPACGGGGGGGGNQGPPPNPGTPPGTYTVVVTATSGSLTSTAGFTLILK
jgi:hypothetical protein